MAYERAALPLLLLLLLATRGRGTGSADGGTASSSPASGSPAYRKPLSTSIFLESCSGAATLTVPKDAIARPRADGKKPGKRGRNPKAGHRFGLNATHAILCVPQMVGHEETFAGLMVRGLPYLGTRTIRHSVTCRSRGTRILTNIPSCHLHPAVLPQRPPSAERERRARLVDRPRAAPKRALPPR